MTLLMRSKVATVSGGHDASGDDHRADAVAQFGYLGKAYVGLAEAA
jgi:hypothetical protein